MMSVTLQRWYFHFKETELRFHPAINEKSRMPAADSSSHGGETKHWGHGLKKKLLKVEQSLRTEE